VCDTGEDGIFAVLSVQPFAGCQAERVKTESLDVRRHDSTGNRTFLFFRVPNLTSSDIVGTIKTLHPSSIFLLILS